MEKEEKLKKEHGLLDRIRKEFEDGGCPALMDTVRLPGTEVDLEICNVMFSDSDSNIHEQTAGYYFLDNQLSSPDLLYFTGVITLYQDINTERLMELIDLVTLINANLPFGDYTVNISQRVLMLRLDGIYNASCSDDDIYPHLTATAASLLSLSEIFSPVLVRFCEGMLDMKDVREMLKI